MKLLFFSDIHGVPEDIERVFFFDDALKPDLLVQLGDALYHGPRNGVPCEYDPKVAADLLNSRKERILAVRGNCDADVDQMLLQYPIMADYSELLLPCLRFFLTHGHMWNERNLPPLPPGSILAHGHTHVPVLKTLDCGITIFNPGSIALPKMNYPKSFGFYDGYELSVRRLSDGTSFEP